MKKILYFLNVDWNWIKQRPQFIAEGLSEKHQVVAVYQYRYGRKAYQHRDPGNVNLKKMMVIPRIDRYRLLSIVNVGIRKAYSTILIHKFKPEVLYITLPSQVHNIPSSYSGKIIYDCMDDHYALCPTDFKKKELLDDERKLCAMADSVICTSKHLSEVIVSRYGDEIASKITIVRNGYGDDIKNDTVEGSSSDNKVLSRLKICYFGTIGAWFDFDLLLESIRRNDNIYYYLYGPVDGGVIPESDHIIYKGTIEHEKLYEETKQYDCFIMPFKLNDIVESVDPVKLYEYINYHKNILCIRYKEVDRFDEYVYFYDDIESYMKNIELLLQNPSLKYTNQRRIEFLQKSSWERRVKEINELI